MKKEKRIYLKPQVEVMDVQTEGVIAGSGGEIIVDPDRLCDKEYNSYFSAFNSCHGDAEHQDCPYTPISNCNIKEYYGPYKTCNKDNGKIYHIELRADNRYHIYPCNHK